MPTFDVGPTHYARAVAVAAGVAILGGFLWWAANLALVMIFQGQLPGMFTSLVAIPLGVLLQHERHSHDPVLHGGVHPEGGRTEPG